VPVQRDTYIAPGPALEDLARWCTIFDEEGLAPEEGGASAGNLSYRTTSGFVITPTRSRLKANLGSDDFVEVVRLELLGGEDFRVHFLGGGKALERMPSSDAPMHHMIYVARTDVAAVLHGHDYAVLKHADRLGVVVTPQETQFGTLQDARATVAALGQADYVVRRGHGFVAVGRTIEIAGRRALEVHRRALALG
jgi:ribulose-5-phosphate 4-epimerase/fuculose-1-phosphate aldolase